MTGRTSGLLKTRDTYPKKALFQNNCRKKVEGELNNDDMQIN